MSKKQNKTAINYNSLSSKMKVNKPSEYGKNLTRIKSYNITSMKIMNIIESG